MTNYIKLPATITNTMNSLHYTLMLSALASVQTGVAQRIDNYSLSGDLLSSFIVPDSVYNDLMNGRLLDVTATTNYDDNSLAYWRVDPSNSGALQMVGLSSGDILDSTSTTFANGHFSGQTFSSLADYIVGIELTSDEITQSHQVSIVGSAGALTEYGIGGYERHHTLDTFSGSGVINGVSLNDPGIIWLGSHQLYGATDSHTAVVSKEFLYQGSQYMFSGNNNFNTSERSTGISFSGGILDGYGWTETIGSIDTNNKGPRATDAYYDGENVMYLGIFEDGPDGTYDLGYSFLVTIPEPSSVFLGVLGTTLVIFRRRR